MKAIYELSYNIPRTVIQFALIMLLLFVIAVVITRKTKLEYDRKQAKRVLIIFPIFVVLVISVIVGLTYNSYLKKRDLLTNGIYEEVTGHIEAQTYNGDALNTFVVEGVEFSLQFENVFTYHDVYAIRKVVKEGQYVNIKYVFDKNQNTIIHIDIITE